jgi:archaellum component FlaG (FlaF/FlaG flagellin family)
MQRTAESKTHLSIRSQIFLNIFLLAITGLVLLAPGVAHAMSLGANNAYSPLSSCAQPADVTGQSLLVVLLDRSGSLIDQPGATDPDGYSTSVTKALADLWPGSMAVIPFSNESTPVLGPAVLTNASQRANLKNEVEGYPIGGATPLAPAMHKALDLLKNAPAGSRMVIVTDGSPQPTLLNGVDQASDIRSHLIPQFCSLGIPVNTFGLALDLTQPDGQIANKLLSDIANGTGGTYTLVRNAHELAHVVVQLYATWQHLVFAPVQTSSNNYNVSIDTYAKRVIFVTFRSANKFAITLAAPDGQPIPDQAVQRSTDRHYEIDSMVLSDVNQPGTYSINVSGDSDAQAYALVESRLHAVLTEPTAQTVSHIGQPLTIQAELYEDNTPIIPKQNEATVNAQVTVLVNGKTVSTLNVELMQQNNSQLFSRQITLPGPVGQVHIQVKAVYLQIPVDASDAQVTIPLEKAIVVQKPVPSCGTNFACYWHRYSTFIVGIPLALVLLLLLLFLLLSKGPYGTLTQGRLSEELGTLRRPFFRKLFHKSTISSRELEEYGTFNFCDANFDLIFKGGGVSIRARSDAPEIKVRRGTQYDKVNREGTALADGDAILVEKCTPATFYENIDKD